MHLCEDNPMMETHWGIPSQNLRPEGYQIAMFKRPSNLHEIRKTCVKKHSSSGIGHRKQTWEKVRL
jgi:hypothetical protein